MAKSLKKGSKEPPERLKTRNKKSKRLIISLGLVSIVSSIFAPVALAGSGDPWYTAPITWILDFLLGVLGGIHDPADHIFYNGCGIAGTFFKSCADRSVWGMFTTQQFNTVIYRGFWMFAGLSFAFICASVIKSGVLLSYSRISSTLKFEVNDALVKTLVATILIAQFFTITSSLFALNNGIRDMAFNDLKAPQAVVDNMGNAIPNDGRSISGRVEMNSLCQNTSELTSPIARSACSLTVRGVSIWWEVFYLQRKFMIAILIILAPLWISCMFYPMLHGVTMTAWKELWAQIVAQAIHAVLYWIYFHMIDDQMGWFQMVVGLCLFIPISESIRFIFGATSQTGGKLAAAGTLVGAAGMMNLTKGMMTVGKGLGNGFKAYKGLPIDNKQSSGGGHGLPGMGGNMAAGGGGTAGASYGGSEADLGAGRPISMQQRKLRAAGEIGAGFGRAAGRMAFGFAGSGMGGAGAYIGGEIGETVGDGAGYRSGVAGYVGGRAAGKGAAAAGKRVAEFPSNFSDAYGQMTNRDGDWSAKTAKSAHVAAQGGLGRVEAKRNPQPLTAEQKAANLGEKRERSAERAGAVGEMVLGRGGYAIGDSMARSSQAGRKLTPSTLTDMRDQAGIKNVFALETANSSVLAFQDQATGEFKPISNLGRGNATLSKGETVVTPYEIQGKGNSVRLTPVKEAVPMPGTSGAGKDGGHKVEYVNASYLHNEQGKSAYNGKTMDANLFISPSQKDASVDLRRRNFVPKKQAQTT
ncbi:MULTISPECIES: hypothetical protein [unclassified Paenibacillus]|uniref:hypothetical protein n=1 Tax=unclassified Paenibacillus TaxID=185978 RepID=UPI002785B5F0|nr:MULTISPECIES: hypothetical protein [unclassified Paenibacillus]MDQ0896341.1 hypothetical protein [Paenibacillus sp. V4I7]MDQ0914116.1 hypothetical protein [Paenibacillus sp. V4I5]